MNSIYRSIDIDLYSPTSYEVIKAQQGDNNSRILEFILYNQGKPYVITDDTLLKFMGHRGDGSYFLKDETDECIQLKENKILVSLTDDILYYSGMIEAKLVMYDNNGNILSTVPFKISCTKSPCDENDLSKGERSKIEDLILKVEEFSRNAEKTVSDAKGYADAACEKAIESAESAVSSSTSARNASTSEAAAKVSEINAALSASTAEAKALEAETSASNAKESEKNAERSESFASDHEYNAKRSENAASLSEEIGRAHV